MNESQPQPAPPLPPELQTSDLDANEKLCAILEGTGKFRTLTELKDYLGWSWTKINALRKRLEYQELVQATIEAIAQRLTAEAADIETMFNQQIQPSVATLASIRDNPFAKDADRIKSSLGLIDHAPAAPRAKSDTAPSLVLQLPVKQIEEIREALEEEGEGDLIELMQGKDFKQIELRQEPPGEDYRVPVREID